AVYNAYGLHANRPHEIFAEDFRALFADPLGNYSGTVENAGLQAPGQVWGLRDFIANLGATGPGTSAAFAYPNPSSAGGRLSLPATEAPALIDGFDAGGRRVRPLSGRSEGGRWSLDWDGRSASGERVAAGIYLARVRGSDMPSLRMVMLPPR